jgi:hypothetical protein
VVSQIKPEKYSGGVWSLKREEGSETGVLLAVEVMFCELDRKA